MLFADLVEITLVEYFSTFWTSLIYQNNKQNQNLPIKLRFDAIRGFGEHSLMQSIVQVKRHLWSKNFVRFLVLLCFVPLVNLLLKWGRHCCWWRAALDICLALMAKEQYGFITCHIYCDMGQPFQGILQWNCCYMSYVSSCSNQTPNLPHTGWTLRQCDISVTQNVANIANDD